MALMDHQSLTRRPVMPTRTPSAFFALGVAVAVISASVVGTVGEVGREELRFALRVARALKAENSFEKASAFGLVVDVASAPLTRVTKVLRGPVEAGTVVVTVRLETGGAS
jgi:hypothetical protein